MIIQQYKGYDGISDKIVFELDTINKCNFNCVYCEKQNNSWNPNRDKKEWNKTNNIMQYVDFFKNFPYDFRIHLLGGEPTLHKDLEKFIEALPDKDIKLFSNGSNIKRLIKLSKYKNLSLTISIHPEEYTKDYFNDFIKNNLHSCFNHLKFLGILYDLENNEKYFIDLFDDIKDYGLNLDMYLPFDENGEYKATEHERTIAKYLYKKYNPNYITLNGFQNRYNHLDIENILSQNKECSKNLWLIDYKGQFHFDGTNIKYNFEDLKIPEDYIKFQHKFINCSSPCWCPANNYYMKIRK